MKLCPMKVVEGVTVLPTLLSIYWYKNSINIVFDLVKVGNTGEEVMVFKIKPCGQVFRNGGCKKN